MVIYGMAVDQDGIGPATIEFMSGTITNFKRGATLAGAVVYNPDRYIIFPGFIDTFIHDPERLPAISGGIVATIVGTKLPADAVAPLHLFFDTDMLTEENRKFLTVKPKLKNRVERLKLLEEVKNGGVRRLVSDHHAVTIEQKLKGDIGTPQFDTYGPFMTWLISQGVDPVRIWELACYNPGMLIANRKLGRLLPGYEASITVLDLHKSPLDSRPLFSRAGWSPFDLRTLPGSVSTVYLYGQKVIDELYVRSDLPI